MKATRSRDTFSEISVKKTLYQTWGGGSFGTSKENLTNIKAQERFGKPLDMSRDVKGENHHKRD